MKPANAAPTYVCMYEELAEIARAHGYALAVHGSLARDFDLIAIPWIDKPAQPEKVVDAIVGKFALRKLDGDPDKNKPHGRIAYTLIFKWGTTHLDLQFMPATEYAMES